jgi:Bacterial Ig domain
MSPDYDTLGTMTVKSGGRCARYFNVPGFTLNEVRIVEAPRNGKLVLEPKGRYIYTPNKGFIGNDTFHVRHMGKQMTTGGGTLDVFWGTKWTMSVIP